MLNERETCDKCQIKQHVRVESCPVSLLLGQDIKWKYCEDCYKEDLKLVPIMKAKFDSEEEFNKMLDDVKKSSSQSCNP